MHASAGAGTSIPGEHLVHFYKDGHDLATVVVDHVATELASGGPAILVCTPEHAVMFREGLGQRGIDLPKAAAGDRLVFLDAADTLASLVVNGAPDADRFEANIGSAIRRLSPRGERVCAFGEMVGLLWSAGDVVGAVELERLWNDLATHIPLSLLCAYPLQQTTTGRDGAALADVCDLHSDVVGGPVLAAARFTRTLPATGDAPRRARRLVAEALDAWGRGDLVDDAILIVTELVTNAVVHAGSTLTMSIAHDRETDTFTVAIGDRETSAPRLRPYDRVAPGGRGLPLVEALTSRWGHTVVSPGKLVWAELGRSDAAR
ncbi:MAG TPA: MEDS domain-containing protein [Acidimicrobiales bacterium]